MGEITLQKEMANNSQAGEAVEKEEFVSGMRASLNKVSPSARRPSLRAPVIYFYFLSLRIPSRRPPMGSIFPLHSRPV